MQTIMVSFRLILFLWFGVNFKIYDIRMPVYLLGEFLDSCI